MKQFCRVFLALGLICGSSYVQAQPTLTGVSPNAVAPGKTIEVSLTGTNLDDPLTFWSSVPGKFELLPGEAGKKGQTARKLRVTLEPSTPVGLGGLVAATRAGASDPLFLMVDDLESVADNGANHSLATAQALTFPVAVDGAGDPTQLDFYKFSGQAGQRVSFEVVAQRLGSPYDGVLRVLDASGKELAVIDDDPGSGADPRLSLTLPADGDYIVELRENKYGGGRYRLRVGDFPIVSVPYPLGGRLGSTTRIGFLGKAAEGVEAIILKLPDQAGSRLPVSARFPSGKSSGMAILATSSLPESTEIEPNNDPKIATPVTLPCAVSGGLQSPRDQDYYQFPATKGQAVVFTAVSRSLGSPSLLTMRVLNADGGQLAETAVSEAEEFTLSFTFPADGIYLLLVEDLLHRGGPDHAYRVEIQSNPGFSLSLKNDPKTPLKYVANIATGGFAVDVQIARAGYDGPIELFLDGAAEGFRLYNNVVPAKAATHRLLVGVPAGIEPGALRMVRVTGRPSESSSQAIAKVSSLALLRTRQPLLAFPPSWLDGLLPVATSPEAPALFGMATAQEAAFYPRGAAQGQFTMNLERKVADFKDPITLVIEGLPPGMASAVKVDKDQYQVTLTGGKDLPSASHAIRLIGYGELKGQGQVIVRELPLQVADPVTITLAPAGPLLAGQTQKIKVTVARRGSDPQPIVLKWKSLPPGVTGAESLTLAPDQAELDAELTAAADAAAVSFAGLSLEATTKYAGQDLTVASAPATLEVKKP